mgnify:CR=1 FL=1
MIIRIKRICKLKKSKFFLSNDIKLANQLKLDGAYIPAFNHDKKHLSYNIPKSFMLIGSAHNHKEIKMYANDFSHFNYIKRLLTRMANFL